MKEYPHIDTIWKRTDRGELLIGQYSTLEFEYLSANQWVGTEKIDGTNVRVMWQGGVLRFGGKTDAAQMPTFLLARLQDMFTPEKMAAVFPGDACLYGEGFGARIQKGGGLYLPHGVDFVLFDVWVDGWWLRRVSVEDVAVKMGIRAVPLCFLGTLAEACEYVQQPSLASAYGAASMEGLVLQPVVPLFSRKGERVIAKIKAKDYAPRSRR